MNARFAYDARRFLIGAATGLLLVQPAALLAQTAQVDVPTGAVEPPRIIRHASSVAQLPQTSSQQQSEVLRELEQLYSQDGQQMPSMDPAQLPNTTHGPRTVGQGQPTHVRRVPAGAARNDSFFSGLLRRLNPFARFQQPRVVRQPQQQLPTPPPRHVQSYQNAQPQANRHALPQAPRRPNVVARPPLSPPAVDVPMPGDTGSVPRELPADVRSDLHSQPVVQNELPAVPLPAPPEPAAPLPSVAQPEVFDDPFAEGSESGVENADEPFTGMKLTDPLPAPRFGDEEPAEKVAEQQTVPVDPTETTGQDPEGGSAEPTVEDRMEKIAARSGTGFKGFCPVALRDDRELVDADSAYYSRFGGDTLHFSSAEAKAKFDAHPELYAPVSGGKDPVLLYESGREVDGILDHALWYQDRLHLFHSAETLASFLRSLDVQAQFQ